MLDRYRPHHGRVGGRPGSARPPWPPSGTRALRSGCATGSIVPRLAKEPVSPTLGRLLERVVATARTWRRRPAGQRGGTLAAREPDRFSSLIGDKAPRWAPRLVSGKVATWGYQRAVDWLVDVRNVRTTRPARRWTTCYCAWRATCSATRPSSAARRPSRCASCSTPPSRTRPSRCGRACAPGRQRGHGRRGLDTMVGPSRGGLGTPRTLAGVRGGDAATCRHARRGGGGLGREVVRTGARRSSRTRSRVGTAGRRLGRSKSMWAAISSSSASTAPSWAPLPAC